MSLLCEERMELRKTRTNVVTDGPVQVHCSRFDNLQKAKSVRGVNTQETVLVVKEVW